METDLRLCERAERNDLNTIAPRILARLADQSFANLATAQGRWHLSMVDDDQAVAGAAVGHFGLDAIDNQAVAPFRRTILALDCLVFRRRRNRCRRRVWWADLAPPALRAFQ